jgi:hypothetical protein
VRLFTKEELPLRLVHWVEGASLRKSIETVDRFREMVESVERTFTRVRVNRIVQTLKVARRSTR